MCFPFMWFEGKSLLSSLSVQYHMGLLTFKQKEMKTFLICNIKILKSLCQFPVFTQFNENA